MIIKQISVFLENKPGQLSRFIRTLADKSVDLLAMSIAETSEYGVLRIITDNAENTLSILRDEGWPCKLTDVLAVTVPDTPGSLTGILSCLAENDVSLAYSYAFFSRQQGKACIVLRVQDNEKTAAILKRNGIEC